MEDRWLESATRWLRAMGLDGLAAPFVEAAQPLTFVSAQVLYAASPMLTPFLPEDTLISFTRWLEDPATLPALAHRLSEDPST